MHWLFFQINLFSKLMMMINDNNNDNGSGNGNGDDNDVHSDIHIT